MRSYSPTTVVDSFDDDRFIHGSEDDGEELKLPASPTNDLLDVPELDDIEGARLQMNSDLEGDIEIVLEKGQIQSQEDFLIYTAHEAFEKGLSLHKESNYVGSNSELLQCQEIREDMLGRVNSDTAKCHVLLGKNHYHLSDVERALDHFCRAFRIEYELAAGKAEACSATINWINKSLDKKGEKAVDAKSAYWKKFMSSVDNELKGDKHRAEGSLGKAAQAYQTALSLEYQRRNLSLGGNHDRPLLDAADLYYKIGRCYQIMGNHARAICEFRPCYGIYMIVFGKDHRYSNQTYDRMTDSAFEMGFRVGPIEEYFQDISKAMQHERTGDRLAALKNYEDALREYEEALRIEETTVGRMQVACGNLYVKIGKAQLKQKQPGETLIQWCRAVGVFETVLGRDHKKTASTIKMIRSLRF